MENVEKINKLELELEILKIDIISTIERHRNSIFSQHQAEIKLPELLKKLQKKIENFLIEETSKIISEMKLSYLFETINQTTQNTKNQ